MNDKLMKEIQKAVETIKYGSIEIVIHDAKVVHIEKKEKLRLADDIKEIKKKI